MAIKLMQFLCNIEMWRTVLLWAVSLTGTTVLTLKFMQFIDFIERPRKRR